MAYGYDRFKWVADQLGLSIGEPRSLYDEIDVWGLVDGVPVKIHQWKGELYHVTFEATRVPAGDMRLMVKPAATVSKIAHLFGAHDIEVGEKAFDDAFEVKADEPERAKAFLTPAIQSTLLAWKRGANDFWLTDDAVHLWVLAGAFSSLSPEMIVADVRAAASLARLANEAMKVVPPSQRLAPHLDAWRAYADAAGLAFSASPLQVYGEIERSFVVARVVPTGDQEHGVDVRLKLDERLPWLVRVRPAAFFDFMRPTGDAHRLTTGDDAFDEALHVTTTDDARTKQLLDGDVRAALLGLHREHGEVMLDPDGVSVRTKALRDPSSFGRIVERVATVAHQLVKRSETVVTYRDPA